MITVIDLDKWRQDRELARMDRDELSTLFLKQADDLAQLLLKAREAARRMSAVGTELSSKEGVKAHHGQSYAVLSAPLLDHLTASHDLAWNMVVLARDMSMDVSDSTDT